MKRTRVILYGRVSTLGQDPGLQMNELCEIAHTRDWQVVGEFVDRAVSGSVESRPALDEMMDLVRTGKADLVVVWKLDRLGRSLGHLIRLIAEITECGVGFVSVRDAGIDTSTAGGRLLLHMLGAFAEFERNLIQERVTAGIERARAKGVRFGRPRRELDLRAAHALLAQGNSLRAVAEMLDLPRSTLRRRLIEAGPKPLAGTPA